MSKINTKDLVHIFIDRIESARTTLHNQERIWKNSNTTAHLKINEASAIIVDLENKLHEANTKIAVLEQALLEAETALTQKEATTEKVNTDDGD